LDVKNILIVDDDEVMLELLGHMLEDIVTGEIVRFSSSIGALRFLQRIDRISFDLIISDWQMPDLNGVEFLRMLRDIDKKIPFLMLTANPTLDVVIGSKQAGVTDFIVKPFNSEDLLKTVKTLLKENRQLD
jgi:two-component system, chemotaxis family, chemotaxis protein CheY